MTFSPQAHADGSATMQQGLTTVMVSVFGPREPRSRANAIHDRANLVVEVGVAGWSQPGVGQRNRGDKSVVFSDLLVYVKLTIRLKSSGGLPKSEPRFDKPLNPLFCPISTQGARSQYMSRCWDRMVVRLPSHQYGSSIG